MVRLGVKESRAPLARVFVLVLVFLGTPVLVPCDGRDTTYFEDSDLAALQALCVAWNGTIFFCPDGWNSSQPHPIPILLSPGDWVGVQCITTAACQTNNRTGDRNCSTLVVGLSIIYEGIEGIEGGLPPAIGNFSMLTSLELVENPNLTGPLPDTLNNTKLLILDLRDNGLSGKIPDFGDGQMTLRTLDLSGNKFSGSCPYRQLRSMVFLQKLNLGRNDFEGGIPSGAFDRMWRLLQLDLSSNRFTGNLPNLDLPRLEILDVSNNQFEGRLPSLTSMISLQNGNFRNNAFSGKLPDLFSFEQLFVLDLSHNQFTETLEPESFRFVVPSLEELYLDHNHIKGILNIGYISENLSKKSANSTGRLRILSLMNNSIDNVIYDDNVDYEISTIIRLEGNPYCNRIDNSRFRQQACNSFNVPSSDKGKIVMIAAVSTAISMLLLIGLVVTLYKYRKYKQYSELQMQQKFEELEVKPTIFPYNQLRTATRDFHSDMKLGQGAFGAVYKGIFPNGNIMAVKQLFATTNQGIDEFLNEVVLLTGMKHRNLVNLKGCCIREQQRFLVYEYVDNYDIDKLLLGVNETVLSWPMRFNICLGVARGLHYLHALAHPKIIHRDIKASNILLAKNYETKIADFGLARLFPDEQSCIMTEHIAGTKGYLAPEYASFGQLSDKVDVYSFGVLCLEVVSGRRNINSTCSPEKIYLCKWAWDLLRYEKLMDLIDPLMSLQDEEKLEVHRLINIALLCIQNEAQQRPYMERVIAMLQGESEGKVMPLKAKDEEQYLESIRLFVASKGDLSIVKEEEESSFMDSSRQSEGWSKNNDSKGSTLELSEISS